MTTGLVALPINDILFEEQRPYPGHIQDNCKQYTTVSFTLPIRGTVVENS